MEFSRKGGLCDAPSPLPPTSSHRSHLRGDLASNREHRALGRFPEWSRTTAALQTDALKAFAEADTLDREGPAAASEAADLFYRAALLLDVLNVFGKPTQEVDCGAVALSFRTLTLPHLPWPCRAVPARVPGTRLTGTGAAGGHGVLGMGGAYGCAGAPADRRAAGGCQRARGAAPREPAGWRAGRLGGPCGIGPWGGRPWSWPWPTVGHRPGLRVWPGLGARAGHGPRARLQA